MPAKLKNAFSEKLRVLVGLLCLLSAPSLLHAKQLALVADKSNVATNLKASDLVAMFNAHQRTWPDGKPIVLVMRDPGSEDAQLIFRRLLNLTSDQARALIEQHPAVIVIADTDDAILHIVSNTRGAIGFIDLYSLTKDVNVVKVDGKLPLEPGYLLKGN
jgi:ABC-type phosphate transport system substrate-binding protein